MAAQSKTPTVSKAVTAKIRVIVLGLLPGMHALEVPAALVKKLGGFKLRALCVVTYRGEKVEFPGGLMALGEGRAYIMFSKARMKALGVAAGATVQVTFKPDKSAYGVPVPEEFSEMLRQDTEGSRRFHLLPPGRQRNLINFVATLRSSDGRLERAFQILETLKTLPEGKEDLRILLTLRKSRKM